MSHYPRPMYRSVLFRLVVIFAGFCSAATCMFAPPQWLNTPGLRLVHSYGLPWWTWGVGFAVFAAMLTLPAPRWHVRGSWLALFLYSIVFVSVLASTRWDRPTNFLILSLALVGLAALYQTAKLATFDREGL